jgi:hypothetical protein
MSRFRILRIDEDDPVSVGKKTRLTYAIYASIPVSIITLINLTHELNYGLLFYILIPVVGIIYFLLLKKLRSTINNLQSIGEFEITQSCFRKRLGDSVTEYNYKMIKEVRLTKHIPATRISESKSRYFSYILRIIFHNNPDETLVVSDRSVDHNHKISIADTLKTLKKMVPFEVKLEI